ncbi:MULTISPECIES: hypothetical protein [Serratia]|nr:MULTISPECIES: hypothetical protein [Serratia]UTN94596.1 hypothetical protein NLX81_13850 [Serratia plymuthica]
MEKYGENKLKILKDISIISIIPVVAYFSTYLYYLGFSFYFGYPYDLIEISISNMLKVGADFLLLFIPSLAITGLDFGLKAKVHPFWISLAVGYSALGLYNVVIGFQLGYQLGFKGLVGYKIIALISILTVAFLVAACFAMVNYLTVVSEPARQLFIFFIFLSSVFCCISSGFLIASKHDSVFLVEKNDSANQKGDYIFINSSGSGAILGRCDGNMKYFKRVPSSEALTLKEIKSSGGADKYRECFDVQYYNIFPKLIVE